MSGCLMLQGTGSNVGKSLLVAGLCRAARNRGLRVMPFKPQNMSNNAAVTEDDGEIGRAQALQALAAGVEPLTDMNPVLLKPETDTGAQVIVQGRRFATLRAEDYTSLKPRLLPFVLESFERLRAEADLILVEGAGSPAEVNLRAGDIANMGFARGASVPVILVGDIDRGGVIAQIIGTQEVLDPGDAALVQGFIINKFRGNRDLFSEGYTFIEERTGWPGFGVMPYISAAHHLPAEDALDLRTNSDGAGLNVVVLGFSRIANFDDFDPLAIEPGVHMQILRSGEALPGNADLVILPGSKSTMGDLAFLRAEGWDIDLLAHIRRGGRVLGICGGYQMLGRMIHDPQGIEGSPGSAEGLGLLDVETTMTPRKRLTRIAARHRLSGVDFTGYEIHIGRTSGTDCTRPFASVAGAPEGATSADGRVIGSYLHGMFAQDNFRAAFLAGLGVQPANASYADGVDAALDELASEMEAHLDVDRLLRIAARAR